MNSNEPDSRSDAHEPFFFLHTSIVTAVIACAALYFAQTHLLSAEANWRVLYYLAFIPARLSESGDGLLSMTTFVSYSLLHASLAHLAVNMIWLAAFGTPLAQRIGAWRFAAFWVFAAICAALLHLLTHVGDPGPMVGASGVVSAAMGAAARFGFAASGGRGPRAFKGAPLTMSEAARSKSVISFIAIWAVINFVSGAGVLDLGQGGASIAFEAHIGGFLAGFFGLRLFDRRAA